jgi:hypothetical protein
MVPSSERSFIKVEVSEVSECDSFVPCCAGGQPLLIVGIAGPVVMLYQYLFNYCKASDDLGVELFRPFCSWWGSAG